MCITGSLLYNRDWHNIVNQLQLKNLSIIYNRKESEKLYIYYIYLYIYNIYVCVCVCVGGRG